MLAATDVIMTTLLWADLASEGFRKIRAPSCDSRFQCSPKVTHKNPLRVNDENKARRLAFLCVIVDRFRHCSLSTGLQDGICDSLD